MNLIADRRRDKEVARSRVKRSFRELEKETDFPIDRLHREIRGAEGGGAEEISNRRSIETEPVRRWKSPVSRGCRAKKDIGKKRLQQCEKVEHRLSAGYGWHDFPSRSLQLRRSLRGCDSYSFHILRATPSPVLRTILTRLILIWSENSCLRCVLMNRNVSRRRALQFQGSYRGM